MKAFLSKQETGVARKQVDSDNITYCQEKQETRRNKIFAGKMNKDDLLREFDKTYEAFNNP